MEKLRYREKVGLKPHSELAASLALSTDHTEQSVPLSLSHPHTPSLPIHIYWHRSPSSSSASVS